MWQLGRVLLMCSPVADHGSIRPYPTDPEVTAMLKKVISWLVVAFVVFYVIQAPEDSAQLVRTAGHALGDAASSLAAFVGSLV